MAVGAFMGQTFTVSRKKIYTPESISGSAGADWTTHERAGQKARSQYIGPKLRIYDVSILLRAQDGVNPREIKDYFIAKTEAGAADYFIIGGKPLSSNRFVITDISEEWDTVIAGVLAECSLKLSLQEYL
jgi:hypothetical protein